jgi:dethiobiotin synthetase
MGKIVFITGTDTGAGKTTLTALLLYHLRQNGCRALAMKPFCSGGREDLILLNDLQNRELPQALLNPFFFKRPLAPLLAARREGRKISFQQTLEPIRSAQEKCDLLLVEGAGGIFVPVGEHFCVADVISALKCPVLLAAQNRLGVINHALLTIQALRQQELESIRVVLMNPERHTLASRTNPQFLSELISPLPVLTIPFLGPNASRPLQVKQNVKKLKKLLDCCLESSIVSLL